MCRALYMLLRAETGVRPPWGMLTGVRPVRLLHDMRRRGLSPAQQQAFFCRRNDVSAEKYKLAVEIANNQQDVIKRSTLRSYSLYISIPFCPVALLILQLCLHYHREKRRPGGAVPAKAGAGAQSIAAMAEKLRLRLETVYIGGGTPTAVSAQQLARLMARRARRVRFFACARIHGGGRQAGLHHPRKAGRHPRGRGHAHLHQPADAFRRGAARHWGAAIRRRTCWTASPPRAKPGTAISIWTSLPAFRWIRPPALKKPCRGLALSPGEYHVHTAYP